MGFLKSLFTSKKFVVMLGSIVSYALARVGFDVSAADANNVLLVAGSYIVGQGVADHGKEAEKVRSQSAGAIGRMLEKGLTPPPPLVVK